MDANLGARGAGVGEVGGRTKKAGKGCASFNASSRLPPLCLPLSPSVELEAEAAALEALEAGIILTPPSPSPPPENNRS